MKERQVTAQTVNFDLILIILIFQIRILYT